MKRESEKKWTDLFSYIFKKFLFKAEFSLSIFSYSHLFDEYLFFKVGDLKKFFKRNLKSLLSSFIVVIVCCKKKTKGK